MGVITTKRITEVEQAFTKYIFDEAVTAVLSGRAVIYGALYDQVPCGLLVAVEKEREIEILSLAVEEAVRRKGVATALLQKLQAYRRKKGISAIVCSYLIPSQWEMGMFLEENQFGNPRKGNEIYELPFDTIRKSSLMELPRPKLKGRIMQMSQVSLETRHFYKEEQGNKIPFFVTEKAVEGEIVDEATLAYVYQERILAFMIVSHTENQLYLHSVYAKNNGAGAIPVLLQKAFLNLMKQYTTYSAIYVSVVNQKSRNLLQRLAGEDFFILKRETVYETRYEGY